MEAASPDLTSRLGRLERDLEELARIMARRPAGSDSNGDPLARISFSAWLRISGPTFAVMVFGFTLLWNAQQTASAQLFEVTRTMGRLEGAITGLETRLGGLDERLAAFDARMMSLDDRIGGLDDRIGELERAVGSLQISVDGLAARVTAP